MPGDTRTLTWVVVAFLVSALVYWGASYAQTYLVGWVGQRVLQDLRIQLFAHLQSLSVGFYSRRQAGVLISRMTNDVQALDQLVSDGVVTLVRLDADADRHRGHPRAGSTGSSRCCASSSSPCSGSARWSSGSSAPTRTGRRARRSRRSRRTCRRRSRASGSCASSRRSGATSGAFAGLNDENYVANMRTVHLNAAYFPAVELLSSLVTAAILFYGGLQAIDGEVTIGVLVAFIAALNNFFDPIQQLSQLYTTYQAGMAALDKIFELLDEEPDLRDKPGAIELPRLRGEIAFEDVTFAYAPDATPALRDVDLHVPAGQTVALVGSTGAGKSTFAKLAARFYDPTRGARAGRRARPARRPGAVAPPADGDRAAGGVPVQRHAARQPGLRPARRRRTSRSTRPPGPSARTTSSPRSSTATTPRSASAGSSSPPASASSSPSRAR